MFTCITHMTTLSVVICVMNVRNQTIQAFVTCSGPCCDCSCKCVYGPQNGPPMRAKNRHFKTTWEQTFDNYPTISYYSFLRWWPSTHGVETFYNCSQPFYLRIRKIVSRISSHVLPCHRTQSCSRGISPNQVTFQLLWHRFVIRTFSRFINNTFVRLAFTLSTFQVHMVKKCCGFVSIHIFHQFVPHGYFWQYINWFKSLFLEMVIIQAKPWKFVICLFCSPVRRISLRTFEHVLPCRRTTLLFVREFFCQPGNFSVALAQIRDSYIFTYSSTTTFVRLAFTLSTFQVHMVKKCCGFSRINEFSSICSTQEPYSAFFESFQYHPHKPTIIILVFDEQTDILNSVLFPNPSSSRPSSNCPSHKRPASGWPYKFRSRRTSGSSMVDQDFCHLSWKTSPNVYGHSDFVGILSNLWASSIFTWVYVDAASAACPSQSGSLASFLMRRVDVWVSKINIVQIIDHSLRLLAFVNRVRWRTNVTFVL